MTYEEFLKKKENKFIATGFDIDKSELNKNLFDYQKDVVRWALKKGRAALFEDCGLGKTLQQLEWAHKVCEHTNGNVLILCPLAVARQTAREGNKFGIDVNICRSQEDVKPGINITNYDKLHKFDASIFKGIVLDESSILKSFTGKMRTEIIDSFKYTPYKLSCTATPSPNDYMELGNQSEFLGVMNRSEMLSTFFIHDGGDTSKWRLKGHAIEKFWKWVSSWAVMIDNPKNMGYNIKFELPELNIQEIIVETHEEQETLIPTIATSLNERREARRNSLNERMAVVKNIIGKAPDEQFLIWCDFNYESEALKRELNGIEVKGSDSNEDKENSMMGFSDGSIKLLITKPSIAGFGMNWQQCHNMIFFGLSDSFEQFYQAVRRCWRFGQKEVVNVYVVIGEREISVLQNIKRKKADLKNMQQEMLKYSKDILKPAAATERMSKKYIPVENLKLPAWI